MFGLVYQRTWRSIRDILEQVHVGVEADPHREDRDLFSSVGLPDRMHNLLRGLEIK